jgi:hypothetical protein
MDPISEPTLTNYQQVTVDVPEERLAEFHAFFARFLAGRGRRRRHREHHHRHGRGHGCGHRQERAEQGEAVERQPETSEKGREITEV